MPKNITQTTIAALLSGHGANAKKFAGKHVLVARDEVLPMKKGEPFWDDFNRLTKKYGERPVSLFVPRSDVSYILFHL